MKKPAARTKSNKPPVVILLGASGYVGKGFAKELKKRRVSYIPLSRNELDYTDFDLILGYLKSKKPTFLINAAGYTGRPNVDACELGWEETLIGNTLFPQTLAHACRVAGIPWGHVSSGCIYSGAKIAERGNVRVEKNLIAPKLRNSIERNPAIVRGFTESDRPNFSFDDRPVSFYSGTKALAEKMISKNSDGCYVWRLRIPFNECDEARNYLKKIQAYDKVYDNFNSLSHLGDFVSACLDLWQIKAPYGIYNVTNPGFVSTKQVIGLVEEILKPRKKFEFWKSDKEFYKKIAKTPRSNCVLDVSKLLSTGVKMRTVQEALVESLTLWKGKSDI